MNRGKIEFSPHSQMLFDCPFWYLRHMELKRLSLEKRKRTNIGIHRNGFQVVVVLGGSMYLIK
jgi:hypothetical protein